MLTVVIVVLALLAIWPALSDGNDPDHLRALAGLALVAGFMLMSGWFSVSIREGGIEIEGGVIDVTFEDYFHLAIPLAEVVGARKISPRPHWRYSMGLSTNWRDRVCCSHGGELIEIELSRPHHIRLWPRRIELQRLWVAVTDTDALLEVLETPTQASTPPASVLLRAA